MGCVPEPFITSMILRLNPIVRHGLSIASRLDFSQDKNSWKRFGEALIYLSPIAREREDFDDLDTAELYVSAVHVPAVVQHAMLWVDNVSYHQGFAHWVVLVNVAIRHAPASHSLNTMQNLIEVLGCALQNLSWFCSNSAEELLNAPNTYLHEWTNLLTVPSFSLPPMPIVGESGTLLGIVRITNTYAIPLVAVDQHPYPAHVLTRDQSSTELSYDSREIQEYHEVGA